MEAGTRRSRRKKPIPAALATTTDIEIVEGEIRTVTRPLIEQLAPTDPLRMRHVASHAEVRSATEVVHALHAEVIQAARHAAESPAGAAAHRAAVRAHQEAIREVLNPAILKAEAEHRTELRRRPAVPGELAGRVLQRLNADRVLAVDTLLRRNPHWADPDLWTTADTVRYLAKAVASEARFIASKQEAANRSRISRALPSFRARSESEAMLHERLRLRKVRKGMLLLQQMYRASPSDQRRIVTEMAKAKCGPYAAASRLGLPRSAAVALRARAERLLAKKTQTRRSVALH